jgi:arylsulfatase A-like enzyme
MLLKKVIYLSAIAALLFHMGCAPLATEEPSKDRPPNVILLLADDLGYGDLSCYGSQSLHTPHLDSLAADGMRFTRFYSGSAVCTPSRASLLTGKFPLRFNITRHFSDSTEHLPPGTPTLPRMLKEAGYATAHIGKWRLGGLRPVDYEARQKGTNGTAGRGGGAASGAGGLFCRAPEALGGLVLQFWNTHRV